MYKFIQSYYYTSFHLHCENIASAGMHFYESKVVHNVQQLQVWKPIIYSRLFNTTCATWQNIIIAQYERLTLCSVE